MKTEVLAVRLQEDQLEALHKMADSRGLKVSELVKEIIAAALKGDHGGNNAEVMARLDLLEANVMASQSQQGDVFLSIMRATAGARYYAKIAVDNSDEVISYLANQTPLDPNTKAQWQSNRAVEEVKQREKWIEQATQLAHGEGENG